MAKHRGPRFYRLKRAHVRRPFLVLSEARRAGLDSSDALAMLEQETGIPQANVFGCDYGARTTPPYCHQPVTKDRVRALLAQSLNNGVGWTQITYRPFVVQAEHAGGAHRPKYQMRVGFSVLAGLIRTYGREKGHAAYNGTGPAADAYGRRAVELAAKWHKILN